MPPSDDEGSRPISLRAFEIDDDDLISGGMVRQRDTTAQCEQIA